MTKSKLLGFINEVDAFNADTALLGQEIAEAKAKRENLLNVGMKVLGLKKAEVNDMLSTITGKFHVAGQEELTLSNDAPVNDGMTPEAIAKLDPDFGGASLAVAVGEVNSEVVTNGGNPGEAVRIGNVSNFASPHDGQPMQTAG